MNNIFKIIGILVALIAFMVWYTLRLANRLTFNFGLTYLDLSRLGSIASFSQGTSIIKVGLRLCIVNPLSYSIKIKDLKYQLYYQGTEIARSANTNPQLTEVNILSNRETCFETETDFIINAKLALFVLALKSKTPIGIEYVVRGKFYFIPFTKKGTYIVNEPDTKVG